MLFDVLREVSVLSFSLVVDFIAMAFSFIKINAACAMRLNSAACSCVKGGVSGADCLSRALAVHGDIVR